MLPIIDYDQLAQKVKDRADAMKNWSTESRIENMMRTAYSVLYIRTYDSLSAMANDIRTACCQLLIDLDNNVQPNPILTFSDKLKVIHKKYYDFHRTNGKYKGEFM